METINEVRGLSSNFTLIKDCPSRTKGRLDFTLNFVRCFRSGQHLACHSLRWDYLRPKLCFFDGGANCFSEKGQLYIWKRYELFFSDACSDFKVNLATAMHRVLFHPNTTDVPLKKSSGHFTSAPCCEGF